MVKAKEGFGKNNMVRLWAHESLRVFGDRLVDDTDREWFLRHLVDMVRNEKHQATVLFGRYSWPPLVLNVPVLESVWRRPRAGSQGVKPRFVKASFGPIVLALA